MKLTNQVCPIELAKKIKSLGIFQEEAPFMWFEVSNGDDEGDEDAEGVEWHPVLTQYNYRDKEHYAVHAMDGELTTSDGQFCSYKEPSRAFTVAEMGEMLVIGDDTHFINTSYDEHMGNWACYLAVRDEADAIGFKEIHNEEGETEAEARAEMLIYLLENKIVTADDCNSALKKA
jgi:hypothetical protein